MKYFSEYGKNEIRIKHICSPESLVSIVETGHYQPTFTSDYGADAGLNCFSNETGFVNQAFGGEGAILHLAWRGESQIVNDDHPVPYPKDVLLIFEGWRAFIPIRSDSLLTSIRGYEFYNEDKLIAIFSERFSIISKLPYVKRYFYRYWSKRLFSRLKIAISKSNSLVIDRSRF